MNSFGRMFDIAIAVICMFIIPFLYFGKQEVASAKRNASQNADYFLECVQNSGCLSRAQYEKMCRSNISANGYITCEIELERTEYLPEESGGTQNVRYSSRELITLLDKESKLPLRAGDSVTVTVYYHSSGGELQTLVKQGRTVR